MERRAELNTRKLEEKERKRAEEREFEQEEDEASDQSSDFIVSDDDDEDRIDARDEPEAAGEMSKNILETGAALFAMPLDFAFFFRISCHFISDTPLFACQCSKGKEREVVFDVMAKCASPAPTTLTRHTQTPALHHHCHHHHIIMFSSRYFTEMSVGRRHKVRAAFFNESIPGVV